MLIRWEIPRLCLALPGRQPKFDCSGSDVCCLSRIGVDIGIGVAVGFGTDSDCDPDSDPGLSG